MQVPSMYHSAIGLSNGIRVEIKANASRFGRHRSQRRAPTVGAPTVRFLLRFDAVARGVKSICMEVPKGRRRIWVWGLSDYDEYGVLFDTLAGGDFHFAHDAGTDGANLVFHFHGFEDH